MAAECAEAVAAGAGAIHVHPKDDAGRDSLRARDVDRWIRAVRIRCPEIPVGVTTGACAVPGVADRLRSVDGWEVRPDFASVNWHEPGADQVAAVLAEKGIGVEAGIWHEEGLQGWVTSPVRSTCLRALVEVQDMPEDDVAAVAAALAHGVRRVDPDMPLLLHGEERSTWAALDLANRWGLAARVGLEDTLALPDGRVATGNAELVATAVSLRVRSRPRHGSR